ncbi:conserved hypothetical protein [Candidatus Desulfarcum epimagneticum]|uniref:Lcl C-terminal domain-containing protein n=1 Tax=uncultured Desulfobacteraceae bacterium TaxID=218296 RepID=A0A484HEZ1_9BACT|nr:conserved hypothetical protein [uncultured Desulfobacteraceae bacterium]
MTIFKFFFVALLFLISLVSMTAFSWGEAIAAESEMFLRDAPINVFTDEEARIRFRLNKSYRPLHYAETEFNTVNDGVVVDSSNGLMWQKTGSDNMLTFTQADDYIKSLNEKNYNGKNDWRLPTIEELVTLMSADKNDSGLFINPAFSASQTLCWSSDTRSVKTPFSIRKTAAWGVNFVFGYVFWGPLPYKFYVRAVRRLP